MKVKFKWTDVNNDTFIDMNKIVVYDGLLSYPNFNERFMMHTDAIKTQLRRRII